MIVYRIEFPNGKNYVGATKKTLEDRKKSHLSAVKSGSDYPVHLALKKYKNEVKWNTLERCDSLQSMYEKEKYYIDFYKSKTDQNGYNVKSGGFYLTGTHGKNISEKRKQFFSNIDNRVKHSMERGGELFFAYDLVSQSIVGHWVNQAIGANFLNVSVKALNRALMGKSTRVSRFVVLRESQKELLPEKIKNTDKPFKVTDKFTRVETKWMSKTECSKELGMSESTIVKALRGHTFSDKYRFKIEFIDTVSLDMI